MGDMAEYMREREEVSWLETECELDQLLRMRIWRTARGDDFLLDEMSDRHLENCINYINNGGFYYKSTEWLKLLKQEKLRRMGVAEG